MTAMKRFGAAEMAVVVAALRRGARLGEAARAAGFSRKTLCYWRAKSATFAAAWADAVKESGRPMLAAARGEGKWQLQRARRNRFTLERKIRFFEHFCATCDATASAAEAEVSVSTVFCHRRSDPVFAAGWREALEQGYARLEAQALADRIAAMEKMKFRGDKTVPHDPASGGEFEKTLNLLREYRRTLAEGAKSGRPIERWDFEAAFADFARRLAAFKARIERGEEEDDHDDDGGDEDGALGK